jgi:cystathionine beta-lyase
LSYDFDSEIDRRNTNSAKWEKYAGQDVLPFWVADMDFATPGFIVDAVRRRLSHPVLGYTRRPVSLTNAFQAWLSRSYGWTVPEEWVVWIPGVVPGVNLTARAVAEPGDSVVIPTPVYYPFLSVPANAGLTSLQVPLALSGRRWIMDFEALQDALDRHQGGRPRLLLLANPQNPTGRVYAQSELVALADFCLRNDLYLCSDEIHAAIVIDENARHLPIASLYPEIGERTVSLYAATKTYNMPGLPCAAAVIPNAELRRSFLQARAGLVPDVGPLAYAASEAAFSDEGDYLAELLAYLRANHTRLAMLVGERMTPVEATYLAWIDVRGTRAEKHAGAHFERFGLGLSDGAPFAGSGFVRFNFACPQSLLYRGLERLEAALAALE